MSDPAFEVTYRVGMANLNAFFGTWLKRTWFDRTSRRRFLLYWAIVTALIGIGLRSFIADKHMWQSDLVINLIGGALGGIAFLLYSAVITFVLTQALGPPLIYLAQTATFTFGPMSTRPLMKLKAGPSGVTLRPSLKPKGPCFYSPPAIAPPLSRNPLSPPHPKPKPLLPLRRHSGKKPARSSDRFYRFLTCAGRAIFVSAR